MFEESTIGILPVLATMKLLTQLPQHSFFRFLQSRDSFFGIISELLLSSFHLNVALDALNVGVEGCWHENFFDGTIDGDGS